MALLYGVPLLARAFVPHAVLGLLRTCDGVLSEAVLLAIFPVAFVGSAVWPSVDAVAVLLVAIVLPFIELILCELVPPEPMHHRVLPLPVVLSPIFPLVDPEPMLLTFLPLSGVLVTCFPYLYAYAILATINILSEIFSAVEPCLVTHAMFHSVQPAAAEDCAVCSPEDAVAAAFVACPSTLIDVAVGIEKLALLARLAEAPLALVYSPIRPSHLSSAMAHTSYPLPAIHGIGALISILWPRLNHHTLHALPLPERFCVLGSSKVQRTTRGLLLSPALDELQELFALYICFYFLLNNPD